MEEQTKTILNAMLERADQRKADDETAYNKINEFIHNFRKREGGLTILSNLANPRSGLNPFIRALIKLELPEIWYNARTVDERSLGGKSRKSRKSRRNKH
jgi:hypothetical protein